MKQKALEQWASPPTEEGAMEKEIMIKQTAALLERLYYEDVEFFWDMIARYAAKKGIA